MTDQEGGTLSPGPEPMQAVDPEPLGTRVDPRPLEALNAPASGPTFGYIAPGLWALLETFEWRHEYGLSVDCEGCANDGEPGYCLGPFPGREQTDLSDADGPGPISCHCGHAVVFVGRKDDLPKRGEWWCPGEDSEHWPKREGTLFAECGHCGWEPDEGTVVDYVVDELATLEEVAAYYSIDDAARIGQLAADEKDRRRREAELEAVAT